MITVNTATEDELSEIVAIRLIKDVVPNGSVVLTLRKGGAGYLRASFGKFCQMAQREYVLLLTDLDRSECAQNLISSWTGGVALPPKLVFRVPVREIEAWLLADRQGMAQLLGVGEASLPLDPDALPDPKRSLLNIAKGAARNIRAELLITRGSVASQGLGYNRVLAEFVSHNWSIERAIQSSASLRRAAGRLAALH